MGSDLRQVRTVLPRRAVGSARRTVPASYTSTIVEMRTNKAGYEPLLDDVCLQAQRTDNTMQLEKQAAGVTQRLAFRVAAPKRGCLRETVRACGRCTTLTSATRSASASSRLKIRRGAVL